MNPKKLAAFAKAGKPPMPFPKGKGGGGGGGDHHEPDGDEHEDGPGDHDGDEGKGGESDEDVADRVGNQVQSGDTDEHLSQLMDSYDGTLDDGAAPPWAKQADLWERAVKAVDPEDAGDERWDDPWLVVAHVYKALGGKVDGHPGNDADHEDHEQGGGGDEANHGDGDDDE